MYIPPEIVQRLFHFLSFLIFALHLFFVSSIINRDNHFQNHHYRDAKKRAGDGSIVLPEIKTLFSDDKDVEAGGEETTDSEDDDDDDGEEGILGTEKFTKCFGNKPDCVAVNYPIYDARTHQKLLNPDPNQKYSLPNSRQIPKRGGKKIGYCGFGKLLYDTETKAWACQCFAPEYFGGDTCDEIGKKLIKENNCTRVSSASDILNSDVSTFNPFTDGICSRCVSPDTQIPVVNSGIPLCRNIIADNDSDDETIITVDETNPCKYDALNPRVFSSPNNFYFPGYGCVCDYHNGFVEVTLPSRDNENKNELSNACVKIGKDKPSTFHRTDVAYYTLNSNFKPVQVHSYKELEYPFNVIFSNARELLIKQRIGKMSDNYDWLNRVIKPKRKHPIRRINYPEAKWPVVHKRSLVNNYSQRDTTYPISATRLATGRGNETKHWYETTNDRFLANAVSGRPIVYTYYNGTPWTGRVTLNPLGAKFRRYYGATILSKPGEVTKLDTRGYESEKMYCNNEKSSDGVVTLPPNYKKEMMDESTYIYLPYLYISYEIED